tara:strand:+ start:168 stop:908 length:741 start_codon:yes stop_codon:yes gene_type:complete
MNTSFDGIGGISIGQLVIVIVIAVVITLVTANRFNRNSRKRRESRRVGLTGKIDEYHQENIRRVREAEGSKSCEAVEPQHIDDTYWYERYTHKFEQGEIDSGIWAKAMALHDGDEATAKYEYIRLKVTEKTTSAIEQPNMASCDVPPSQTETFFNAWYGWLIALLPCAIAAWIVAVNQGGLNKAASFLIGQLIGGTLASAIPGLLIGGVYILIKRPQVGATIILKKCIFWSAVVMTVFVVIGIQSN